jgi:hypothetical protein
VNAQPQSVISSLRCLVNEQVELVKISSIIGQFEKATFACVATHFDLDE